MEKMLVNLYVIIQRSMDPVKLKTIYQMKKEIEDLLKEHLLPLIKIIVKVLSSYAYMKFKFLIADLKILLD